MKKRAEILSANIRLWLKVRELTVKEAAKLTGLDYRLLQRWASKGVARIRETTREDFEALAEAMGSSALTADELFKNELLEWRFEDPSRRSDYFITSAVHEICYKVDRAYRYGCSDPRLVADMLNAIERAYENRLGIHPLEKPQVTYRLDHYNNSAKRWEVRGEP